MNCGWLHPWGFTCKNHKQSFLAIHIITQLRSIRSIVHIMYAWYGLRIIRIGPIVNLVFNYLESFLHFWVNTNWPLIDLVIGVASLEKFSINLQQDPKQKKMGISCLNMLLMFDLLPRVDKNIILNKLTEIAIVNLFYYVHKCEWSIHQTKPKCCFRISFASTDDNRSQTIFRK